MYCFPCFLFHFWGKREDNWSNFLCILSAERTHIFASIASAPGLRRFPPFPRVSFSPLPISSQEVTNFRHFTKLKEKWTEKENSAKKSNQSLHQSIRCCMTFLGQRWRAAKSRNRRHFLTFTQRVCCLLQTEPYDRGVEGHPREMQRAPLAQFSC